MSQSLRDELRAATQLHHNAIENTIDLMRPDITMADYVGYLCKFYGYYSVLELRLIKGDLSFCDKALKLDGRRKVERLESDICKLCGWKSLEKIPLCQLSPLISNATDVVGCSYVIEGSTLGALIMYRHLHNCLGVTENNGASFIYGYGESTGAQWKRFVEGIEAMTFDVRQRKACIEAAISTFETMGNWFTKQAH
ncbi:MAG: biliverdin-producing heme oxygenase [Nitrosospira sp.]